MSSKAYDVISALKKLTQEDQLTWVSVSSYLDTYNNRYLKTYLIEHNKYRYTNLNYELIEEYSSLCAEIAQGIVYIFSVEMNHSKEKFFLLGLQQSKANDIYIANDRDDFQEELSALVAQIKNSNRKSSSFLDEIISLANDIAE